MLTFVAVVAVAVFALGLLLFAAGVLDLWTGTRKGGDPP
jgi:hypothetical protein